MDDCININIPDNLAQKLKNYRIQKDTNGMSPAAVYKLSGANETLYLKYSPNIYSPTTFGVNREAEILHWLHGKMNVPHIIAAENFQDTFFMLMTEVPGVVLDACHVSPGAYIESLAKAVMEIQAIDISGCPFESNITFRLNELKYLMENNLTDTDPANWEESTDAESPDALYAWLWENRPEEELVFSHGDITGTNIVLDANRMGFLDLGRAGKADKWNDIAFCVNEIRYRYDNEAYVHDFFSLLNIQPDWDKIKYFTMLDELF